MATYQRGVISTLSGAYGMIQSLQFSKSSTEATAPDEMGEVAAFEFYDDRAACTIEVIWDTTKTLPDIGDIVTLSGTIEDGSYAVSGVSVSETNKEYKRATLNLIRFVANALPAAVTSP